MKNIVNLVMVLFVLLNQVFYSLPSKSSLNSPQNTPTPSVSSTTPTSLTATATETSDFGAYPPPVTSTPETEATTPAPTVTPSLTALPATPTPAPTSQPTAIPTEENPNLPPSIRLQKDTLTYAPGQSIDIQWKLENTKSSSVKSSWRIEFILPMGWSPVDTAKGVFNPETQLLEIIPSSYSDKLSVHTSEESGDQEIQATFYDNDVFLFNTSIFLRSKKTATVLKDGGEIEGKAGNVKIKVTFPKDALPSDSVISIQTPEKYPGTLPFNGKRVIELTAEDLKGNKFHKFNGAVQIEIPYDPADIGIHPSTMALYWFDEETGAWRVLPGEADRARNVFVAQTNHFSLFALGENSWESRKIPPLDVAQIASFTGAASYSIPIDVPNGPGGIKPSISIDYNSMSAEGIYFETPIDGYGAGITAGAQPSWVGTGWSLSSGGVVLRSMGKDTSWDGDDTFSLAVGGMSMKLIPVSEGLGFIDYKSPDENFWKIRRIKQQGTQNYSKVTYENGSLQYQTLAARSEDDKWVVWDKSGMRFTFDKRAYYMEVLWDDSRINEYNCDDGNRLCTDRPWGWFLTEILYPSGQKLTFTYEGEQDKKCYISYDPVTKACAVESYAQQAMYPLEIQYPDGKTKVSFISEGRSDFIWYWGDSISQNRYEKKRLSSIRVMVNSTITREYKLNYFATSENPLVPGSRWTPIDPLINNNNRNYERILALKSVAQYGRGGISGGSKLPDITFSYSNQMFLTDVDNGQGGKASFTYEVIDPNANSGEGSPFTAAGGDPDQNKTLYQGGGIPLHVNEVHIINPLPNDWDTSNGLPVRPGQGYRLTCTVRNADGQVQFGMYYSNENTGAKNYSKLVNVTSSGGTYAANVVIPASANRATPAIKFFAENTQGSYITVTNCSGIPVLTHYRATQRVLSDITTNVSYIYSYAYQGAATNDTAHSANATLDANRRSGASVPYTEFRGHSKVIITYPNGLRTETSFYQDDVNKGRISDFRQYNGSLLLNRNITHLIDTPIIISDGQVPNICAKKTKNDACYLDQKVIWSFSDWDESRDYGQGVTDENSTAFVGLHKIYQYTIQAPYGYGNLQSITEQNRPGSIWVSYRLTRNTYPSNVVDGGTTPDSTRYLVGLPGAISLYQCPGGVCDETLPNLVKSSCNIYDDPINGGSGICSLYQNGSSKTEVSDTPDTGLLTGTRTLLHFGDGASPDYTTPHYSDIIFRYDSKGNRIRTTQYSGEGTKTSLATIGAQVTEACFGVLNQPSGCQDDGYFAYLRWEKNAKNKTTSWTYDYSLGLPVSETDPNGAITYAFYDPFGRYSSVILPGDNSISPTYKFEFHDGAPFWVVVSQKTAYGLTSQTRRIYDGLGRVIQSQQANLQLASGYKDVVVDTIYDYANRITRQSVPIEIAPFDGSASIYRPQTGAAATLSSYDLLGRLFSITAPDQTVTTYTYGLDLTQNRLTTTIKDSRNKETITYLDVLNRTSQVTPLTAGPGVSYQFDVADRMLSANYGNATSTMTYDLAGRKKTLNDADMGIWSYQYDGLGNLKVQVDARGCTVNLNYDELNRLTGKVFVSGCPGNTNPLIFTYDQTSTTNSGVGRRTGMNDHSGSTAWEYDLRGRLIHEAKTVIDFQDPANQQDDLNLGIYHTYWSYNPDDTIKQKVYPNQETINYSYINQKAVNQVSSIIPLANSDFTQLYTAATQYDGAGRIISQISGNQLLQSTYTYYDWTTVNGAGRLRALQTSRINDNYPLQDLRIENTQTSEVGYDAVGNIRFIEDWRKEITSPYNLVLFQRQAFTYDDVNRLVNASVAGQGTDLYSESYQYDPATGNLSQKGANLLSYNGTGVHAVTHINNQQLYQYNPNGYMTLRSNGGIAFSMNYDGENHLVSISGTGLDAGYIYDGDGNRVVSRIGSVRTVYIGDYFEAEIQADAIPVTVPALANYSLCHDWTRCKWIYLPAVMGPETTPSTPTGMTSGNFGNTYYHTHPASPGPSIQWKMYYYAGSRRVALRQMSASTDTLQYLLSDHLGSTTKTIDLNGNIVEDIRYKAWGETRYPSGGTSIRRKYTGQLDAESGLIFFKARWYDPGLGRFIQPDTVIPKPQNPMAWDRYAFSANNPVRYIDPSGHDWLDTLSQFTTGFVAEIGRSFFGVTPQLREFYGPDSSESDAMLVGRLAADVVEIVVSIAAIDVGIGGIGVAVAACATGIGCPGGVAVAAGGALAIGVGAVGVTQGAIGIGLNLAYLKSNNSGGSTNNNPFAANGIRTTDHFLDRLEDWGVSQNEAFSIYKNGTKYTDGQGRLVIWDPKKRLAIVVDSQDHGVITIFEQKKVPSSWYKGWITPGE